MGDRMLLRFKDASSALYVHWVGGAEGVQRLLAEAGGTCRQHDAEYGLARLAAAACKLHGPPLGVGIVSFRDADSWLLDAGLGTIDPDTGHIEWSGGYLADQLDAPDRLRFADE